MSNWSAITERIIEIIEAENQLPWSKPWTIAAPINAITGNSYRGINRLVLSTSGFSDPRFLTFRQARALGGTVTRGQRGIPVVFWQFNDQEDEDTKDRTKHTAPLMRCYTVFNIEQCDGLDLPEMSSRPENLDVQAAVQNILNDYRDRPTISHAGEIACYIPSEDRIVMPPRSCFENDESYVQVLAHELIHSSGSAKRLKRKGVVEMIRFGSETYGFEELIAEIGSAFLCADHSIEVNIPRSAAYVQGWLNALKNDKSMIVMAACQGQKAVDYITCQVTA